MSKFIRAWPGKQGFPGLRGRLIIDTYRGQLRARKWPRKRGRPKSPKVRRQNDWFRDANRIATLAAGTQQAAAIEYTKGTGLYPRDLLLIAMSQGMIDVVRPDGAIYSVRKAFIEDVMFQGCILRLDVNQPGFNGTFKAVTWPLPQIDTAGMWDVAEPTRITVPPGVEVIRLDAGIQSGSGGNARGGIICENQAGEHVLVAHAGLWGSRFQSGTSGPLPVSAGDWFVCKMRDDSSGTINAVPATFFAATILQAS